MFSASGKASVASGSFLRVERALCLTVWLTDLFVRVVVGIENHWVERATVSMQVQTVSVHGTGVFVTF